MRDDGGRVWAAVLGPPRNQSRAGLTEGALPMGAAVTASGHCHLGPDRLEMKTERLRVADRVFGIHPDRSQALGGGERLADLAVWLGASLLARTPRSGPWLQPLVNLAHVLGIVVLAWATLPVAGAGLAPTLTTGLALLAIRATEYAANPFLWAKLSAVAVTLANLGAWHAAEAWRSAAARSRASAAARPSPGRFPWAPGSPPSRRGG